MEVMIANHSGNSFGFTELKKDKAKFKISVKFSKNSTKEVISISNAEPVRITRKSKLEDKKSAFIDATRRCLMLKELREKNYSLSNQTYPECLMIFLKKGHLTFRAKETQKSCEGCQSKILSLS